MIRCISQTKESQTGTQQEPDGRLLALAQHGFPIPVPVPVSSHSWSSPHSASVLKPKALGPGYRLGILWEPQTPPKTHGRGPDSFGLECS